MLLPLDTGDSKPPTTIEETAEIDTLTAAAAGGEDGSSPAAIPEPITQTVVSSETGGVNSYGQLLQAGLSHGGLQPSEIPQVRNAKVIQRNTFKDKPCYVIPVLKMKILVKSTNTWFATV